MSRDDDNPRGKSNRKIDPLATTQPNGVDTSKVRDLVARQAAAPTSERVTAPMRAQTPRPEDQQRTDTNPRADTNPIEKLDPAEVNPLASTARGVPSPLAGKRVTFPPTSWDRQNDVLTSAQREHVRQKSENYAGDGIEAGNMRLPEDIARTVITSRFEKQGIELEADYQFSHGDLLVTLDGYDPNRRVGYQFLSHSDADVVTDFDEATELAFEQLAGRGEAWVMVIHDADVPAVVALEERINKFLAALPQ